MTDDRRDDDDLLHGPVPGPDDEPTAAERAHARTFGELIDKTLTGRALPPAMSADDRALLEVATVIRATSGGMPLAPARQASIVEEALRKAIGEKHPTVSVEVPVVPLAPKKRKLPWIVAAVSSTVAAAAVTLLIVRAARPATHATAPEQVPTAWMSRPSDPLIGPIEKRDADHASARIDTIFADRLEGYRERTLRGQR